MKHIYCAAPLVAALVGCAPSNSGTPVTWESLELQGKKLSLINSNEIEEYQFLQDGVVAATLGVKNGPLTAPVLYWKIHGNQLEISEDSDFNNTESLSSPKINGNVVTANKGLGFWVQFRVSK